jgi:hypothetical protein
LAIATKNHVQTQVLAVFSAGEFKFEDKFAVNFLAVSSNNWITHGTLSSYVGLTANLLYGFRTPSGKQFITAGNTEAAINDRWVAWCVLSSAVSLSTRVDRSYC